MMAAIALQNIGSDCIRIIAAVATAADCIHDNGGSGCNDGRRQRRVR